MIHKTVVFQKKGDVKEIVKEDRKTKHNDNSLNKNIEQVIKSENHPKFQGLKRNDPEIENQTPSPVPAKTAVEEVKQEIKEEKKNEETKPLKKQQLPPITKQEKANKIEEVKKEIKEAVKPKETPKPIKSESDPKVANKISTVKDEKAVTTILSNATSVNIAKVEVKKELNLKKDEFPSLSNKESKEKIKVFKDEDDSDIEEHLKESRKKLKDQMENVGSNPSNPPTPDKSAAKIVNSTDESAAISEGALKDARNYISGVYGKSKANFMRQDPFDYVDRNQQYDNDKNSSLILEQPSNAEIDEEVTKAQEDKTSAGNQGNTSFTDKGKDKIVAYNSESDSEEGDPRFRVGSRFSSYQNQSNKEESKRIESQRTPIEKIAECTKENEQTKEDRPKSVNKFMIAENEDNLEESKEKVGIETMEDEDNEVICNKLQQDYEEKINFNSLDDNEEALFDPLYKSPVRHKVPEEANPDDTAQEVIQNIKRPSGASLKQSLEGKDCMNIDTNQEESEIIGPKRVSNQTNELLESFGNDNYDNYLFGQERRRDSSIEQTNEIAHSYNKKIF